MTAPMHTLGEDGHMGGCYYPECNGYRGSLQPQAAFCLVMTL
jgi:hypothetical protein